MSKSRNKKKSEASVKLKEVAKSTKKELDKILRKLSKAYREYNTFRSKYLKSEKTGIGKQVAYLTNLSTSEPVLVMKYKYIRPETLKQLCKWMDKKLKERNT